MSTETAIQLPLISREEARRRQYLTEKELLRMRLVPTGNPVAKSADEEGHEILYFHPDKVRVAHRLPPKKEAPPAPAPLPEGEPQRISPRRAEARGYFSKEALKHMYYEPTEPPVAFYIRRSGERVDLFRRETAKRLPLPCVKCGAEERYRHKLCRACFLQDLAERRAVGEARRNAHYHFSPADVLFFDMEMTGVYEHDEVLSVSVVNGNGQTVFHSLTRPARVKRWKRTEQIHGITPEMVKDAPTFLELAPTLLPIFEGAKRLIAYGTSTDFMHLRRLCKNARQKHTLREKLLDCAAEFSHYVNEWDLGLSHQSLSDAMAHFSLSWEGNAHTSKADAEACRLVFEKLYPHYFEREA